MKNHFCYLLGIIALFGLSNCANGKKLQEKPPVAFEQAFYITSSKADKNSGTDLQLFIPVNAYDDREVALDSVYFRGKKAKLEKLTNNENVYTAYFETAKKGDIIMSSDPREEYGNQAPIIPKDFPFELKADEAIISFEKGGKTGYYKITGIQEKDAETVKIKYPENIQH